MAQKTQLQQFYIPEEQSIYLLSHDDAKKLKDWVALCAAQLRRFRRRMCATTSRSGECRGTFAAREGAAAVTAGS